MPLRSAALMSLLSTLVACGGAKPPADTPEPAAEPVVEASPETPWVNRGGMWVPSQLTAAEHAERLKTLGLALDPAALADPTGYPLGAVVFLGGCSASFVSPDGLIATNHHCIQRSLQRNSTPERDLLEEGYYAATREEELWNGPTAKVYVTQRQTDVTEEIRGGLEAIEDPGARYAELEKRQKALVAKCEAARANTRCLVAGYYGGAEWKLIERLQIDDVRLVYSPPRPVGNFGGDIDNWRWPRHGGDFAFYRAWVGPDGAPAAHAKDNVPYRPAHYLKLASEPLAAGDLVFVAGYPGRTSRLASAAEVKRTIEWRYPHWVRLSDEYVAVIDEVSKVGKETEQKASPLRDGLMNRKLYAEGSLEGLTRGGAAERKAKADAALSAWIEADPARKERFGTVLADIDRVEASVDAFRDHDAAVWELNRLVQLLRAATTIVWMAQERGKPDAERHPDYQERNWPRLRAGLEALDRRYDRTLDQALLALAVERAAPLTGDKRPRAVRVLVGEGDADEAALKKAIGQAYRKTKLATPKARLQLFDKATPKSLARSKDPLLRLGMAMVEDLRAMKARDDAYDGEMVLLRARYLAALREFRGTSVAPDANRTLRVTYGTVKGYRPTPDKPEYVPFTKVSEIPAKVGERPFDAPKALLDAIAAGDGEAGPYVHQPLGEVPVDYLTDLDITGGNSGSATFNRKGELVGLAFDGNYEAMASDWVFMPELTRSIHVDLRYMLWYLDRVAGAKALLGELGVSPHFAK